ncbi:MAG TPA: pitrilysin family protein, partial [Calditrichia bacterium]|nr:pitrilysin family protein [Calditrichia bacterium]
MTQTYHKTILPSGLTVVSEFIPSVRSVSFGVWIKSGGAAENPENNGVAHFLEHMVFKSTAKRNAREIARSIENLGGNLNAFTSKEQTCFHVEILDESLPQAVEVLADILTRQTLPEIEIRKERDVILDEIASVEDAPEEWIQDYFVEQLFPGHPLGYSILGTRQSVKKTDLKTLLDFYNTHYCCDNIVIAAAGHIDHQNLLDLVQTHFHFPESPFGEQTLPVVDFGKGQIWRPARNSQAHLCLGVPGVAYQDPRKFDLLVLNTLLGGGMGSRLFQNIREEHGIAYNIYSFFDFHQQCGLFGVYLGTDARNLKKATDLLYAELEAVAADPIDAQELAETQSQLKGNLVLGLESTAARMNRLAMLEIYQKEFRPVDSVIEQINRVSRES